MAGLAILIATNSGAPRRPHAAVTGHCPKISFEGINKVSMAPLRRGEEDSWRADFLSEISWSRGAGIEPATYGL